MFGVKMTQIIEYAKIRGVILIYHFEFDQNDQIPIGEHFSCSINKYMCLNDWLTMSQALTNCIGACLSTLPNESMPNESKSENIQLPDLSVALKVNWIKLDPIYRDFAKIPAEEIVHPFVMKLTVTSLSATNAFRSIDTVQSKSTSTTDEKQASMIAKNESTNETTQYQLKPVCVMIEKLDVNEYFSNQQNDQVIDAIEHSTPQRQSNKRPVIEIDNESPLGLNAGGSSTPILREMSERLTKLEKGVSMIHGKSVHSNVLNHAISATPIVKTKMARKARQIVLREKLAMPSAKKKKRVVQKKTKKKLGANNKATTADPAPAKRTRLISSINSTGYFEEEMPPVKRGKNVKREPIPSTPSSRDANEILDLKSISEDELQQSFRDNFTQLKRMFEEYQEQEEEEVIKATDYDHVDIISLLQSKQIQIMLDMLYKDFVNNEERDVSSHASYTDLFFMKIVPEWSLALFMDKFAMNRKDALERIQTQNRAQNIDDSQSLCITQDSLVEYV